MKHPHLQPQTDSEHNEVYELTTTAKWTSERFPTVNAKTRLDVSTTEWNMFHVKPIQIDVAVVASSGIHPASSEVAPGDRIVTITPTSTSAAPQSPKKGLDTTGRLGIGLGIGIGAGLLLVNVLVWSFCWRVRTKHSAQDEAYAEKSELDGQPIRKEVAAHELQDGEIHEMMGVTVGPEIDGFGQIFECEDNHMLVEMHTSSNFPEMEAMHGKSEIGTTSASGPNSS